MPGERGRTNYTPQHNRWDMRFPALNTNLLDALSCALHANVLHSQCRMLARGVDMLWSRAAPARPKRRSAAKHFGPFSSKFHN